MRAATIGKTLLFALLAVPLVGAFLAYIVATHFAALTGHTSIAWAMYWTIPALNTYWAIHTFVRASPPVKTAALFVEGLLAGAMWALYIYWPPTFAQ